MIPDPHNLESTRVQVIADETVTDMAPARDSAGDADDHSSRQLILNYQALLDARAIYYPVAYRFVKELGRGRQGVVFLGMRHGARGCITRHAIKIFDPSIYPDAQRYWTDMGRIADQTSRLQAVRSPNLVARDIYDETNGIGYAQMEIVDGIDLRHLLDGEHLRQARNNSSAAEWERFTDVIFRFEGDHLCIQPGVALYILRQLLRGLETLHTHGFLHSDVKPSNIMLDRLGYVKVVDFGRAVRARERVNFILGSPLYMAPELHRQEPGSVQSDLFSVGLVALEMLRGEPLLTLKQSTDEKLLDFKLGLSDRLYELLPEYILQNYEFTRVLQRFLAPDAADRFPNAEEAESGNEGLNLVHKQLTLLGKDTEYGRELEHYLAKVVSPLETTKDF